MLLPRSILRGVRFMDPLFDVLLARRVSAAVLDPLLDLEGLQRELPQEGGQTRVPPGPECSSNQQCSTPRARHQWVCTIGLCTSVLVVPGSF